MRKNHAGEGMRVQDSSCCGAVGQASAFCQQARQLPFAVQAPSRENGTAERPQALRCPKLENYFSALDAQSKAEGILNRSVCAIAAQRCCGGGFCQPQAGWTLRWARGGEGCSDSPLPTSGLHPPRNGKGAARPFQTPKRKSNRKKSSRFAQRFFLGSPSKTPQPLRRQLPKWGAGMAGTGNFAVTAEAFPQSGEGGAQRRMRVRDSSCCVLRQRA